MKPLLWGVLIAFPLYIHADISFADDMIHTSRNVKVKKSKDRITSRSTGNATWVLNSEVNIYGDISYINTGIDYNQNGWNVGLSVYSMALSNDDSESNYNTFISISKQFDWNLFKTTVGVQNGTPFATSHQYWENFSFIDNQFTIGDRVVLHGGVYFANAALTQTVNKIGYQLGLDLVIVPDLITLQSAYVSGTDSVSGSTININYEATKSGQLYVGTIIPNKNSVNEYAGIIGINWKL